jgi:hypothetical protein
VYFSCQVNVATEVLLDLGARPNQQLSKTHNGKQHEHNSWNLKLVRPVSETGQTDSLGLSLSQAGETGQAGLANRPGRFCPGNPQKTNETKPEQNHLKNLSNLNRKSHSLKETCLSKIPLDNPLGAKPVRPVLPGQSGRTQPAGKTHPPPQPISRFAPQIQVRLWG